MRSGSRLLVLLLSLFAAAEVVPQRLEEQITVSVVEVPVHVSRFGSAVTGLTKDDFILTVNGKPQAIDYFDVVEHKPQVVVETDAATVRAAVPLERRRLIVLLFDLSSSSRHSLRRAQEASRKFVDDAGPGDVFAVATLNRSGITFAAPFMTDKIALRRAIGTLRGSAAADAFGIATLAAERGAWHGSATTGTAEDNGNRPWESPGLNTGLAGSRGAAIHQDTIARLEKFEREERAETGKVAAGALSALADRLAPLSGIKHVVLFGQAAMGLDIRLLARTDQVSEVSLVGAMRELHARYRAAGVVLDAIDTGDMPVDADDPFFSAFSTLHMLSLDTGGSVTRSLPALREMQRVTYILGFRASSAAKENRIDVALRNAPLFTELRYRRTWSGEERSGATTDGLFLADVLLNDIPQRGLSLEVAAQAANGEVVITSTVPGNELLALGKKALQLDAFIYLFDERGQVAEWAHRRSKLDLAAGRAALENEPYRIVSRARLAPGRYTAKVLLRALGTDATAFARAEVVVH